MGSFWRVLGAIATGGVSTIGQIPKAQNTIKAQQTQIDSSNKTILSVEKNTTALLSALDNEKTIVSSWLEKLGLANMLGLKKPPANAPLMDFVEYNKSLKNYELYTILVICGMGFMFFVKKRGK